MADNRVKVSFELDLPEGTTLLDVSLGLTRHLPWGPLYNVDVGRAGDKAATEVTEASKAAALDALRKYACAETLKRIATGFTDEDLIVEKLYWPLMQDHYEIDLEFSLETVDKFMQAFGLDGSQRRAVEDIYGYRDNDWTSEVKEYLFGSGLHGFVAECNIPEKKDFDGDEFEIEHGVYHVETFYFESQEEFETKARDAVKKWEQKDREAERKKKEVSDAGTED